MTTLPNSLPAAPWALASIERLDHAAPIRYSPAWGLGLLALLAVVAVAMSHLVAVSYVLLCIGLGVGVRQWAGVAPRFQSGVLWDERLQRSAVVLAGAQMAGVWMHLSLRLLLTLGLQVVLVLTLVTWAGRSLGLGRRLAQMLGLGTAICGVTAIVAYARHSDASDEEVSAASSVILIFGLLSFLLFPILGKWMGLSALAFGAWAGLAINNTSECIAAGALWGPVSEVTAILVKSVRTLFLVPALTWLQRSSPKEENAPRPKVPSFLWGFAAMGLLAALDWIPTAWAVPLSAASRSLFALGFVGIGLRTSFAGLSRVPRRTWVLGILAQLLIAVIALGAVRSGWAPR